MYKECELYFKKCTHLHAHTYSAVKSIYSPRTFSQFVTFQAKIISGLTVICNFLQTKTLKSVIHLYAPLFTCM